jgi:nucleotide-binding universal stress UspA family protein
VLCFAVSPSSPLKATTLPSHLFVPLDGSPFSEWAVPHAAELARLFDARITLARVPEALVVPVAVDDAWITRVIESTEAHEAAEAYLSDVAARPEFAGLRVATIAPDHPVADGLLEAAESLGVDLIVMTTHGLGGASRWLLGSVADKVVHHAKLPVYLVRPDDGPPAVARFARAVVPLDGSDTAEAVLETAKEFAANTGAVLHLVRIPTIPPYAKVVPETAGMIPDLLRRRAGEAEDYLARTVAQLEGEGLKVSATVELRVTGDVADGILDFAEEIDADLIIMSTHGRSGFGRWLLGSVADRVVRGATRPVWLVRAG